MRSSLLWVILIGRNTLTKCMWWCHAIIQLMLCSLYQAKERRLKISELILQEYQYSK